MKRLADTKNYQRSRALTTALRGTLIVRHAGCAASSPSYTEFPPVDLGFIPMRAALDGGALGAVVMGLPFNPDPFNGYCMDVREDGVPSPGPAARAFTSLEGVSYDRTTSDASGVDQHPEWTRVPYAWRGHDSSQHEGARVYAKIVDAPKCGRKDCSRIALRHLV